MMTKLADSSDLGWKIVHEYQSNPIADDSEDLKGDKKVIDLLRIWTAIAPVASVSTVKHITGLYFPVLSSA
jgi:hypothetical protein